MITLFLLLILIIVFIAYLPPFFWRLAYWIIRRNNGPRSSSAILCLLWLIKSVFKKGLSQSTYKNIEDWNLVHEFENRYILTFIFHEKKYSFYVIADSLGGIEIEGIDTDSRNLIR